MNQACDLYVYADVNGGYTCHVAGMKRVSDKPCPDMPEKWWEVPAVELTAILDARREWVDGAELVPIGLPYDGEHYYCQDRDTMVDTLEMLKAAGYTMPDDLIETIRKEEDDE